MSGTTKPVKKKSSGTRTTKKSAPAKKIENPLVDEIVMLLTLAVSIILLLSNLNIAGVFGEKLSYVMFGFFGLAEYIMPFVLFIFVAYIVANKKNHVARIKGIAGTVTVMLMCTFVQLCYSKKLPASSHLGELFTYCAKNKCGGGFFGAIFFKLFSPFGTIASFVIVVIFIIIGIIIVTEHSFFGSIKSGSRKMYDTAREDIDNYREVSARRYEEKQATRIHKSEEKADSKQAVEKKTRTERVRRGVTKDTLLKEDLLNDEDDDILEVEEITPQPVIKRKPRIVEKPVEEKTNEEIIEDIKPSDLREIFVTDEQLEENVRNQVQKVFEDKTAASEPRTEIKKETSAKKAEKVETKEAANEDIAASINSHMSDNDDGYVFPPIDLLAKGSNKGNNNSDMELKETSIKLQQILQNFGVKVTVTDATRGPVVTRYELTPEQGVKVSKIVSLSDDIKLNLAAADIRIEAPIPGKAAVGIEVPNKETSAVMFRDLVESSEFKKHPSKICFGVGKDIGGKVIVGDIATMPHLLIAGSTGSGKSVCVNSIIMSILYKANPNDVKLIMIDPKVVELKIYNGIPHLLIPVVTDCKKAAGALNWAVAEMDRRYKLFADANVRDLKGYNAKIETIKDIEDETKPVKLPQIVVIVDEVAELMMVAQNEVESAIVRLAQLARAAGIHLVIATQRPTVNVITGLIKANVPSKIAFAVATGIDSRTIIDRNGAEKLLGRGDMLYFPAAFPNPVRVQGAYVSDKEVSDVVDFIKYNSKEVQYNNSVTEHIETSAMSESQAFGGDRDVYFEEAGRFIIEKEKASIGMIQRMYKVGFNRAARIMDQLTDAGVVGPEEGTKPRKILMTMEEFEQIL